MNAEQGLNADLLPSAERKTTRGKQSAQDDIGNHRPPRASNTQPSGRNHQPCEWNSDLAPGQQARKRKPHAAAPQPAHSACRATWAASCRSPAPTSRPTTASAPMLTTENRLGSIYRM